MRYGKNNQDTLHKYSICARHLKELSSDVLRDTIHLYFVPTRVHGSIGTERHSEHLLKVSFFFCKLNVLITKIYTCIYMFHEHTGLYVHTFLPTHAHTHTQCIYILVRPASL